MSPISNFTKPDIAYSVNDVCQFLHSPTEIHYNVARRIPRYVKGTLDSSIMFKKGDLKNKHVQLKA